MVRWSSSRVMLAVCSLLAVGCEVRVSLGAACASGAECPAGLACAAGRCRAVCDDVRGCTPPFACVIDATGTGACAVAEDDACGAGCVEPLACDDGHCVQRCDSPQDCAAGLACVSGSCARAPSAPCDVLTGAGCEAGRRCEVLPGGEVACAAVTARSEDMLGLHETCGPTDTCEAGLACAGGRCVRYCLRDDGADAALTSCGPGSACFGYDEVGAPTPTPTIGFCSQPCDPVTQTGCTVSEHRCEIAFGTPLRQSSCRYGNVFCDGGLGDPGCALGAADLMRCAPPNLALHYLHGMGASGVIDELCFQACDDDMDCSDGFRCFTDAALDIEDLDGSARRIGGCLPACESGECIPEARALGLECEPSGRYCTAGCMEDVDCHPAMRCASHRCTPRLGG